LHFSAPPPWGVYGQRALFIVGSLKSS